MRYFWPKVSCRRNAEKVCPHAKEWETGLECVQFTVDCVQMHFIQMCSIDWHRTAKLRSEVCVHWIVVCGGSHQDWMNLWLMIRLISVYEYLISSVDSLLRFHHIFFQLISTNLIQNLFLKKKSKTNSLLFFILFQVSVQFDKSNEREIFVTSSWRPISIV